MALGLPTATTRWRCVHCGNLTRFDVERRRRTQEFWHLDLAGEPDVEQVLVLQEEIIAVRCRWCGAQDGVHEIPRTDAQADAGPGGTP